MCKFANAYRISQRLALHSKRGCKVQLDLVDLAAHALLPTHSYVISTGEIDSL